MLLQMKYMNISMANPSHIHKKELLFNIWVRKMESTNANARGAIIRENIKVHFPGVDSL